MLQDCWTQHEESSRSTAPQEGKGVLFWHQFVTQDKVYHEATLQLIAVLVC